MCKFKELIEHIAKNSIRIVNLSMGSSNINDWLCFQEAALKNNKIIFVVSAGNNGFDIDKNPIYPASLKLDNIITVTHRDHSHSAGDSVTLAGFAATNGYTAAELNKAHTRS